MEKSGMNVKCGKLARKLYLKERENEMESKQGDFIMKTCCEEQTRMNVAHDRNHYLSLSEWC
jgi:hypothetical protein